MKTARRIVPLMLCILLLLSSASASTTTCLTDNSSVYSRPGLCRATSAGNGIAYTQSRYNNSLESQVINQVNGERAKAGLASLRVDAELTRAARVRAAEIVRSFSHTRPDGTSWYTVSGSAYGENIAMGQRTADKVMAAWMSSPGHRANIMRSSYGSIGVCAYIYNGVTYWVQLFGK